MNSKYNKWVVNYNDDAASGTTTNLKDISIHPEDKPEFYLRCYFDEMGQNKFVLQKFNGSNFNWKYETPIAMELPQKKTP